MDYLKPLYQEFQPSMWCLSIKKQPSTTHENVKVTLKEPNKKDKAAEETTKNKSAPDRISELAKQKERVSL